MTATDLQFEPLSDDCLKVLSSYAVREVAVKAGDAETAGWLDRVDDVPGVDAGRLTMIHGCLIAQGMLKFEITGRSVGLQYQVSTAGREALARVASVMSGSSDAAVETATDSGAAESAAVSDTEPVERRFAA